MNFAREGGIPDDRLHLLPLQGPNLALTLLYANYTRPDQVLAGTSWERRGMFYSPRSAYGYTDTPSPRHTDRVLMSTSIRCRLQLVSGDESRIGWDFKAISAIASEPERASGPRRAADFGRQP
jgi:hypothetical protein